MSDKKSYENSYENSVCLRGRAGKVYTNTAPYFFWVKTVRSLEGTNGDSLDKFDWHKVVCSDKYIIETIEYNDWVEVDGYISTTKRSIIATRVKNLETEEEWPKRRRTNAGVVTTDSNSKEV